MPILSVEDLRRSVGARDTDVTHHRLVSHAFTTGSLQPATSRTPGRSFGKGAVPQIVPYGAVEGALSNLAYHATLGQIGVGPSEELQRWQRRNPWTSTVSNLVGTMLPYALVMTPVGGVGLGARALKLMPYLSNLPKKATLMKGARPHLASAIEQAAPFIPFEATRVGLATLLADEGKAKTTAFHAATDLALIGGFGAAISKLTHQAPYAGPVYGGEYKILDKFPTEYDLWQPSQIKLRMLKDMKAMKSKDELAPVKDAIDEIIPKLEVDVLAATSKKQKQALVQPLVGPEGKNQAKVLNRFLDERAPRGAEHEYTGVAAAGGVKVRKFVVDPKDPAAFRTTALRDEAMKRNKFDPENLDATMYPRHIQTTSKAGRDKLLGTKGKPGMIEKSGMQPISLIPRFNNAWISKERGDRGLYTILMRTRKRQRGVDYGDEYIFFKTDDPGRFLPIHEAYGKLLETEGYRMAQWAMSYRPENMTSHLKYMKNLRKAFPPGMSFTGMPKSVRGEQVARMLAEHHPRLETATGNLTQAMRKIVRDARTWVTPGINRYGEHPEAFRAWLVSQAMFNRGSAAAQEEFFGKMLFSATGSLHKQIWSPAMHRGSIKGAIRDVYRHGQNSRQVRQLNEAIEFNIPLTETGGMEPEVRTLLQKLYKLDKRKVNEILATQRHVEEIAKFRPLEYHYMVSRTWRGRSRVPVYVEGEPHLIVGYGSGTRKQAIAEADAMIEEVARASNGTIKLARSHDPNLIITSGLDESLKMEALRGVVYAGTAQDLALASKIIPDHHATQAWKQARKLLVKEPQRFTERTGMKGFNTNLTEAEMQRAILGSLVETNQYVTSQLVRHHLAADLAKLQSEAPNLHKDLLATIRTMSGVKEPWAQKIDQVIDKVLTPYIGVSATEAVRVMNRTMFDLTLAAGDLGFGMLNAMTPIMTALPEIALSMTVPPARLMKYYDVALIGESNVAYNVSPIKIFRDAFKLMGKPTPEFRQMFNRAVEENVIYKKFIEEFAGSSAEVAMNLKGVLKREVGVIEWLKAVSEYLPARTEEWSRGLAFANGYLVGKNFFRREGEQLFQYAAQFTNRSMYLYTTADRPRIITGTVGSAAGLFKNWSFHNISNMARYTGEGVLHKNWSPLLWAMGGATTVAGIGGIPLIGIVDSAQEFFSDKSLVQTVYDGFGYHDDPNRAVDTLFYGLPAFLGVSLQGRAAAPGANVVRDISMLGSVAVWDRAKHLGMALGESMDHWRATGSHPMSSERARSLYARAMLPRTMYRSMSFTEDRALKSLSSGNRLISDITMGEYLMYTFGMTPLKIEKSFEVSNEMWRNQRLRREAVNRYGRAYADATLNKNWDARNKILHDSFADGLPPDSVVRSGSTILRNYMVPQIQRQFEEYPAAQFQRSLGIYR